MDAVLNAPPADIRDFDERFTPTVDGLKIYVRDYAPRLPITGAPVICLHGLTRNSRDFEIVAPRIAALGRRVLAPDMRGRGRSAYDPDPAHYVPAVYTQDVIAMMDALGLDKAVFVGTSMGGIITMALAALAPGRIIAAALNDMGPKLEAAGLARIAGYVGRAQPLASWADAGEANRAVNGQAFPTRLDDESFWLTFGKRTHRQSDAGAIVADYDPNIALAFTDSETSTPIDMSPLFQALADKPVLSIRGAISDLLSAEGVEAMRAMKSDLMTAIVPDVGHAPLLDEDEAWLSLIDFLAVVE